MVFRFMFQAISPAKHAKLFTTRFATGTILGNGPTDLVMRQIARLKNGLQGQSSEGKTDGEVERFKLIKFAPESVKFTHGRNSCANLYATRPPRACACPAIACNAPRLMRCWFFQDARSSQIQLQLCETMRNPGISSYLSATYPATAVQHVSYPKLMSFFSAGIAWKVKLNRNDVQVRWRIQGIDCQHSSWNLLAKPKTNVRAPKTSKWCKNVSKSFRNEKCIVFQKNQLILPKRNFEKWLHIFKIV